MPDGGARQRRRGVAAQQRHRDRRHGQGRHRPDAERDRVGLGNIQFTTARPRDGWVTSIAFDPRADGVVYATYGNFGGAHVYRSADDGATWQSLDGAGDGALPDIPVHSIVVDPDDSQRLYLGTDLGVMVSIDGGRSVDERRNGLWAGGDDVAVDRARPVRPEATVRVHARPRRLAGQAAVTDLEHEAAEIVRLRAPTP